MDYGKAEGIRKKGLVGLITDNLVGGQGIGSSFGSAISDRTKATFTGIQEKFDPLNIAKTLTGGSKLAPALLGRLTGRKQSTIEYFAGKKRPSARGIDFEKSGALDNDTVTETLGLIYEELRLAEEDRKLINQTKEEQEFEKERQEDRRNQAIIEALTARRKPEETPKEKAKKKKKEVEKKSKEKKAEQTTEQKDTKTKTETKKEKDETKKETTKKETVEKKRETAKKVEEKKIEAKPKVEKAPEVPKPEVKPPPKVTPKEAPKVPSVSKAAPVVKPPIIGAAGAAAKLGAGAGIVISALVAAGFSQKAQANVLAQVKSESNFIPKSESLFYTTAKGIMNTFGKDRIPSEEFAQQFVSKKGDDRSEQLANYVYAKTDGNSSPGDGWKYRGRGFLQITGKNAYKALGDYLKVDLVSNPDLLNTPEIAAKSIPWFFLSYKKNLTKGDPKSLEDISLVNRAVGFSDPTKEKGKKRAELASEIESMDFNSGSQIDQSSKENKDLKADMKKDEPAPIVNNTTNINQTNTTSPKRKEKEDDRPAILEKMGRG